MASSNKVFVSPGVYTSERDLTFVAQSVGVTTLGLVGETLQGPAFEPIFITNFDEYQVYFGGTSPEKFVNTQIPKYETSYIAKAYLQQSNQLFVTRVLGLSGYDAGPSWSIVTIGNINPATISATGNTSGTLQFTGTTGASSNITITSVPAVLQSEFYSTYTQFDGGTSTLNLDFQSFIATQLGNYTTPLSGTSAQFWGSVNATTFNAITGVTLNGTGAISATSETFGVDNVNLASANLSATTNDAWYYALFEPGVSNPMTTYYGYSFGAAVATIATTPTPGVFSGTVTINATKFTASASTDFDDLVVATLRSRGITNFSSSQHGPLYQVTGTSDVTMVCTGNYSGISSNPYATFVISGITKDSDTFSFETSMTSSDSQYLSKVFGRSNFAKDRTEVPLFVEEVYSSLLLNGYRQNVI